MNKRSLLHSSLLSLASKNKRGISAIIATVMIILITVAAVAIVWLAIVPMISNADLNTKIDLTLVTNEGYTLWDSTNRLATVQVERSEDESDDIDFQNFYTSMNRDRVMGYLTAELLDVWGNYTTGPFVYFSHAATSSRYGSWGIYESIYKGESEKSKVVNEWRDAYI